MQRLILVAIAATAFGCATFGGTPTYQSTLDDTLKSVTVACEVVISPEAAAAVPAANLSAAKQACNLAEIAITSAQKNYAIAKLNADAVKAAAAQAQSEADLATANAQLAAAKEATR